MNLSKRRNSFIIIFIFLSNLAFPQDKITPVAKQAGELAKLFADQAGLEKLFDKSLLDKVPAAKLAGVIKNVFTSNGGFSRMKLTKGDNDFFAKYDFFFDKGFSIPVTIGVEQKEPYLISTLFFGPPVLTFSNFIEVNTTISKLPGEASCVVNILARNGWGLIAGLYPDKQLAIGSSFKLYILSELLRTVNNGERNWKDHTELRKEAVSLPSGILHMKPVGTKITVDSLASLMISISDNTATDNLLYLLGRENVEKIMPVAGHSKPELNTPFLATNEMFKLKGESTKKVITDYLSSVDKRKFLQNELSRIKREDFTMWKDPYFIDKVEWFASVNDLCKVMEWIKANSENEKGKHVLDILAINSGISFSKEKWSYVGYKGGSEPGVMNMTYLLCTAKGRWYTMSFTWNNKNAPINANYFLSIVGGAIKILENI